MQTKTRRTLTLLAVIIFPGLAFLPTPFGEVVSPSPRVAGAPATQPSATTQAQPTVVFRADPNPIHVCDGTEVGVTTLHWQAPGVETTQIHVNTPDGPTLAAGGATGTSQTGKWVTPSMTFYLQNTSGGKPLTAAHTLATLTVTHSDARCLPHHLLTTPAQWVSLTFSLTLLAALAYCFSRKEIRPTRLEALILLAMVGAIAYQLFTPPLIGMADNGDFERFLRWRGLRHIATDYQSKYFDNFHAKYRLVPAAEEPDWYLSSTSVLITTARWWAIQAGQQEYFDIRMLAALHLLVFFFGVWLVLAATRHLSRGLRFTLYGLLFLIFTDASYLSYFNSFYSEETALALLFVSLGSALLIFAQRTSVFFPLMTYFAAIALLLTAKPMYAPLAAFFSALGIYLSSYLERSWRYWLSGLLSVILCGGAVWYYRQLPQGLHEQNPHIIIFKDLLPHSDTPRQDLMDLGLNPDWAAYNHTSPYQPDSPFHDPAFKNELLAKVSTNKIMLFYLSHPQRLAKLFTRCAKRAFTTFLPRRGYYEASAAKPRWQRPFGLWSNIRERVIPRNLLSVAIFFATGLGALWLLRQKPSTTFSGLAWLYLLLVCIAGSQFLIAVLAGGGEADLEKHLFMFNLSFDLCLVLCVSGLMHLAQSNRSYLAERLPWLARG
jgi:hypothetical protein